MTAHTLPESPDYALCPSYDLENAPREIRLLIDGRET